MKGYYTVSGDGHTECIKGTWSIHVNASWHGHAGGIQAGMRKLKEDHPGVTFIEFKLYDVNESQYTAKPFCKVVPPEVRTLIYL